MVMSLHVCQYHCCTSVHQCVMKHLGEKNLIRAIVGYETHVSLTPIQAETHASSTSIQAETRASSTCEIIGTIAY